MRKAVVTSSKFIGTIGLGLLSGLSYTLSTLTLPSLLTLPTAHTAHQTLLALRSRAATHLRALTGISSGALIVAYVLSPRSARHPYLLWTAGVAAAGAGVEAGSRLMSEQKKKNSNNSSSGSTTGTSYKGKGKAGEAEAQDGTRGQGQGSGFGDKMDERALDESVDEGVVVVNGEKVRAELEDYRTVQAVRAVVSGMAFAMGVVGIWGDGY